jgi:hypothetical protein
MRKRKPNQRKEKIQIKKKTEAKIHPVVWTTAMDTQDAPYKRHCR